ncbi:MAG: hypothetical protein E7319_01700 [Clostridiales bacterium]|nr:hypothetical protein [Clostridiales bacterium]
MDNRMKTLIEGNSWYRLSRLNGVMRFHWLKKRGFVFWLAVIMLAVQVINLVLARLNVSEYQLTAVSADLALSLLLALICAIDIANKETTFLLRFGTPRVAVWLGNLLAIVLASLAYLLISAVISFGMEFLAALLMNLIPQITLPVWAGEVAAQEYVLTTAAEGLRQLPWQMLWVLEYSCIFYLFGCCLRRKKGLTIGVLVGVPLLLWVLLLLPALQDVFSAVERGAQSELMVMLAKFIRWVDEAGSFIGSNWQWIQGALAFVAMLLSYRCMRGTRQPE